MLEPIDCTRWIMVWASYVEFPDSRNDAALSIEYRRCLRAVAYCKRVAIEYESHGHYQPWLLLRRPKDRPAEDLHPAALLTCLTLGYTVHIPYQHQSFAHLCTKPSLLYARESSNQFLSREFTGDRIYTLGEYSTFSSTSQEFLCYGLHDIR